MNFRPARADDRARIVQAFRALDPASIYTRFFAPKKTVSDGELRRLTAGEGGRDVVRIATVGDGSEEMIVGIGHCVLDGSAADIAFLVAEEYRGRGIAGALLRQLADIARARGITRFEADVLADNTAMRNVFRRSGLPTIERREGASVHLTLFLTPNASEPSADAVPAASPELHAARGRPKSDLSMTTAAPAGDNLPAPSVAAPAGAPSANRPDDGTPKPGGKNR